MQAPPINFDLRSRPLLHSFGAVLLLICAIAAPLWHLHILSRDVPSSQSDLLPRWIGTRAALQGQDPYSPQTLCIIQRAYYGEAINHGKPNRRQAFLYPAPVVLLLAPLAHLSWHAARVTYTAVVLPVLMASFWLCMRALKIQFSPTQTAAILLLACFSWPVVWGLRLEQLTLPVAALVFVAWFLLAQGCQVAPGVLLALATIKPQLVLPLLLWFFVWAILRRCWVFIASFAASLAVLLAATEIIVPGWFMHWRGSLHDYGAITKTAPPLEFVLGSWIGLPLTLLVAGWSACALWRLVRSAPGSLEFGIGVSLALAATVALLPTDATMVYNQVLLLPACLAMIFRRPAASVASPVRGFAIAQLTLEFLAVAVSAIGETITGPNDFWQILPFVDHFLAPLLALVLASETISRTALPAPQTQQFTELSCA